jgi:hypothetical protein
MKKDGDQDARARNRLVRGIVGDALDSLGGEPIKSVIATEKRRAAPQRIALESRALNLIRDHSGLLRWHIGTAPPPGPGHEVLAKRRGLRRAPLVAPIVLSQTLFEKQDTSKVSDLLLAADKRLSRPAWNERGQLWGLRRLMKNGKLVPFDVADLPKLTGKNVLLIIHGTFSNSDAVMSGLEKAPGGTGLLSEALQSYDFVLAFDHPTLAQSPMLNAFDLATKFAHGTPTTLDVIAHSRGGLVARWFCEGFRQEQTRCRVIMVGAPLAGTSLAAPARIKAVMDFLSNAGEAMGLAAGLGGGLVLTLASSLAGFFARLTGALSTPLADAIVAMIPGLSAQSRHGSNSELRALRVNTGAFDFGDAASPVRYWVIRSNFEPVESGVWGFIKSFVARPGASFLDTAADYVFPGTNDLVVDLDSMDQTGESADPQPTQRLITNVAHDFGASRTVHHCNYFEQRQTVQAVRKAFRF